MVWGCLLGSVASSQQLETDLALHQEQLTALRQKAQELVDQHHFESLSIQKKIKEVKVSKYFVYSIHVPAMVHYTPPRL